MSDPILEEGGQTHKSVSHSFTHHPPVLVDGVKALRNSHDGHSVRLRINESLGTRVQK